MNNFVFELRDRKTALERWALMVIFIDCDAWAFETWASEPSMSTVKKAKKLFKRAVVIHTDAVQQKIRKIFD